MTTTTNATIDSLSWRNRPTASLVGDCPATAAESAFGPATTPADLLALEVGGLDGHGTSVVVGTDAVSDTVTRVAGTRAGDGDRGDSM